MRQAIIIVTLLFISLNLFPQEKAKNIGNLYNIGQLQLVQNNCSNNLKVRLNEKCLDTIKCRTDSIFITDSPVYFYFKSFDEQGFLRVSGCIHVHLKDKSTRDLPAKTLLTSLYQDNLSIENYTVFDKNGKIINEALTCCDYYLYGFPTWEDFGTDEFGITNTITKDQIKRMPTNR